MKSVSGGIRGTSFQIDIEDPLPCEIGSIVPTIFIAPLAAAAIASTIGTPARAANECLAAPNAPSPKGSHWYYRLDRANQRKCWYLRPQEGVAQRAAPRAPQMQRSAEAGPAAEPAMKPMAFAPATWPEAAPNSAREARAAAVPRRDPPPTAIVDDRNNGMSIATKQVMLTSNEASVQDDTPLMAAAPAAAPAPDAATVTPLRVLLLVAGILIIPGILLRMIFKFGATTRRRLYADRAGRKRHDGVVSRWAATTFGATAVRPRGPTMPESPPAEAEQLLRKILWELERGAAMPTPGPLSRA